jgi:hypothetical protein
MGRNDRKPAKPALEAAKQLLETFEREEAPSPHVGVTREGSVVFTFGRDRKLASYECDADGDIIFLLSDRALSREPSAEMLTSTQVGPSLIRARAFLA